MTSFVMYRLLKNKILPEGNVMPETRDEARKMLSNIGMDYKQYHACPKDCILYRGRYESLKKCPICDTPRYRDDLQGATIPCKVLRHFPVIPRLQRLFRCKSLAQLMDWHAHHTSTDGMMRVPSDSPAWKHINKEYPSFANESRNVRFGLATDGVNPFGVRATTWSIWPVCLVNYNIPPWLSTKKGHIMLALLIPGQRKVKNMDVYLEPLIDELEDLWKGIKAYDISRPLHEREFTLHAIVMWTMHDYPGLGECSGNHSNNVYLVYIGVCLQLHTTSNS